MSEEKKIVPAVYPALPTCVAEINKEYIHTYLKEERDAGNIDAATWAEIKKEYKRLKSEKPDRYFMPYRKVFAKKFFPQLVKENNTSSKFDLDELFND